MQYNHLLNRVLQHQDLSTAEASHIMNQIMTGKYTPIQIGGFLIAMRMKGEAVNELTGFAKSMIAHATRIKPKVRKMVDTCGTGGDLAQTFNISTLSAIVAAGAGVPIAKHGNRSVSSRCGSADLLEALGLNLKLTPLQVQRCIEKVGIGFLFAPVFHSAMKYAIAPRKELGVRTVFNMLGPLTNPARAFAQVIGVYDEKLTSVFAQTLRNLGVKRAMIVHGDDGLDEITISGPSRISEITTDGRIVSYKIAPEDFGMPTGSKADLVSSGIKENVKITHLILDGKDIGSRRDAVALNAGAAIYLSGQAKTLGEGVEKAIQSIETGKAKAKLEKWIAFTKRGR